MQATASVNLGAQMIYSLRIVTYIMVYIVFVNLISRKLNENLTPED